MSRRNSSVVAVDPEQQTTADANKATQSEQNMTLREGLRLYPKAVAWSVLLSAAIIMEGFDKVLIANLVAVPAFKHRFGSPIADGSYEVTAAWQAGLTNGAFVGEMLGLMINGIIAERLGYKKTMIGALFFVNLAIFVVFFYAVCRGVFFRHSLAHMPLRSSLFHSVRFSPHTSTSAGSLANSSLPVYSRA
jgi:SP family general alpha glucoside:H+ symporter-like MFS transporter